MILKTLKLVSYKNCSEIHLDLHEKFNCFSGPNGSGKTNVLDAVHMLCLTKSFLGTKDEDIVNWEGSFYRIAGSFIKQKEGTDGIVIKFKRGGRKVIERNDDKYKRFSDHLGFCPAVLIAPGDETTLLSESKERRRWMDTSLAQADRIYLQHLITYNRLLLQRNATLKGDLPNSAKEQLLDVYDSKMSEPAELIKEKRRLFTDLSNKLIAKYYSLISKKDYRISLRYQSGIIGESYEESVKAARNKDLFKRRSSAGIHRDDVVFEIDGKDARVFASQGQRKSLLLAVRLSQFSFLSSSLNSSPILLLDDIFDKLDPERVEALVKLISGDEFGQVWITDTEPDRLDRIFKGNQLEYNHYYVNNGIIELA